MAYNRYIGHSAPLPSGALPTQDELDNLRQRTWNRDLKAFRRSVGRLFR